MFPTSNKTQLFVNKEKIQETIQFLTYPKSDSILIFKGKYNGLKQELKIKPIESKRKVRHHLEFLDMPSQEQKEMFNQVFRCQYPE